MNLHDIIASDGAEIFRNGCDFGETAEVFPVNGPTGVSQPIPVLFATSPDQLAQREMGLMSDRQSTVLIGGADWRNALMAIVSSDRLPRPGDVLRIAAGEHAGEWQVTTATPAPGDEIEAAVTWQALRSLGATQGAQA